MPFKILSLNIMNVLTICPCCSTPMLRHLDRRREYWFCRHCWQEMPDLDNAYQKAHRFSRAIDLSPNLSKLNCLVLPSRHKTTENKTTANQ